MLARRHANQRGFSMLELVVVLGILTVMTSVSLSFMDDKDEKHRYQESIVKLKAVKRNFLSVGEYQGKIVASGFLIDNGLLFDAAIPVPSPVPTPAPRPSLEYSVRALLGTAGSLNLLRFSARPVWVNIGDDPVNDDSKEKVVGSQMFKGVRPGLFDLSEYRDSTGTIKDAWGDNFVPTPSTLTVLIPPAGSVTLDIQAATYKTLLSPNAVSFSQADFLLPVSSLSITLKNAPDDTTSFKVALVSFNNEVRCGAALVGGNIDEKGCWHTIKTDENNALTSSFDNMFHLTQVADPSAVYNDAILRIDTISPVPSLVVPLVPSEKLTDLVFSDDSNENNSWRLSDPIPMQDIDFTFSGTEKISAGSHLVVVLSKNTGGVWKIYNAAKPVFEYVHLLPGVTPSPIVISLPEPSP
jgi:prepilin-type N-terminal cleavage/methylation domain-containing protein